MIPYEYPHDHDPAADPEQPWDGVEDAIGEHLARTPRANWCPECKATLNTQHLDGCSRQYHEEWVSEPATRTGLDGPD